MQILGVYAVRDLLNHSTKRTRSITHNNTIYCIQYFELINIDNYAKTLLLIDKSDFNVNQKVQLIELLNGLDVLTFQKMADKEGKTYNGIKKSNRYPKIIIGGQKMAVKGLINDNLPF